MKIRNMKTEAKRSRVKPWLLILVISSLTVAVTFALWQTNFSVGNKFPIEFLEVSLEEEFNPPIEWDGSLVTKKAILKNEGTIPAVIRVQIVENFKVNDVLLSTKYTDTTSSTEKDIVHKEISNNWTKHGDWYYYNFVLDAGTDAAFLESIKYDETLTDDLKATIKDATYELSIIQEHLSIYDDQLNTIWKLKSEFKLPSDTTTNIEWSTGFN